MNRAGLLQLARRHRVAVQTSVAANGAPQAAIVGIAVGNEFEIIFDTLQTSRKAQNLRRDPRVALVLGGWGPGEEQTIQYEGVAEEPSGPELEQVRELYFGVYPDGRERLKWSRLIHIRVRPTWLRYSDFGRSPEEILDYSAAQLAALR